MSNPGRSGTNNRRFVEAMLWIVRTGSPLRDLLEEFGKWTSWTSNACLDRKTSRKTPKKKSAHLERSFLYSNTPNLGQFHVHMYRSSLPVEFEFTTLQLQMTTPQTRMNARGLFTTLFASL